MRRFSFLIMMVAFCFSVPAVSYGQGGFGGQNGGGQGGQAGGGFGGQTGGGLGGQAGGGFGGQGAGGLGGQNSNGLGGQGSFGQTGTNNGQNGQQQGFLGRNTTNNNAFLGRNTQSQGQTGNLNNQNNGNRRAGGNRNQNNQNAANQQQGGFQGGNGNVKQAPAVRPRQKVAFDYPTPKLQDVSVKLGTVFSAKSKFKSVSLSVDSSGDLVMQGKVDSAADAKLAEIMAQIEPGVRRIRNELTYPEQSPDE